MGRIAPRKQVSLPWDYQTLLRAVHRFLARAPLASDDKLPRTPTLAVASLAQNLSKLEGIRRVLKSLWHHPDDYRWMEPLPPFHRRWILIATALLMVVLLWPYSPPSSRPPAVATPVPLQEPTPMQANLVAPPAAPVVTPTPPSWVAYHIASGQTLAQLFRDNNLPVNDVFAMAQVEGRDKPLSNLRAGQEVKLRLNGQGMIAELTIETTDGQVVQFTRQADGAFVRTR